MSEGLKAHLDLLRRSGKLWEIEEEIDLRYASALIAASDKAVIFKKLRGYGSQVLVGGLFSDPERTGLAFGAPLAEAWKPIQTARGNPISPVVVRDSKAFEEVVEGKDVDLTSLPLPVLATRDGAPYISAGITSCLDAEGKSNWGVYRYQLVDRQTLAIDLTSMNNLHQYLKRAYAEKRTLGVTLSLGNHPLDLVAASASLPPGVDEMGFAGALKGSPVRLVQGATVPAKAIADSEYILEGEFLPGGWTHTEGRFGEFHGLMGSMHRNPALRIKRVARRHDAHLHVIQMPRECHYINIPLMTSAAHHALLSAGIQPVAVNVTPGGGAAFHLIASINKYPGAGKNAILALMNVGIVKNVVVTDADIDVFNLEEVEWAIATRVQADKDVIIIPGMGRAKPLDPTIPAGMDPMLITRMGIDATIPEGIPLSRYERIRYPHYEDVDLDDLLGKFRSAHEAGTPSAADMERLPDEILEQLRVSTPQYYVEIVDHFSNHPYRALVQAMGALYDQGRLSRDEEGRYLALER